MFRYGIVAFFITVSQKVIYQTDSFVIGVFIGASAVTFYAIPLTLIEYMRRIVIAMTEVFVPMVSGWEAKGDKEKVKELLIRGTKVSMLLGLPICIVFITLGRTFIDLWMGPEFGRQGERVLMILAITQIFSITHLTSREILFGLSLHRFNAYFYSMEAIVNLVLSVILVQKFGIEGVAVGTAIPHIVIVVFVFPITISRIVGIRLGKYIRDAFVPPILPASVLYVACYELGRHYHPTSLIGYFSSIVCLVPFYLGLAWFSCFSSEERDSYLASARKAFVRAR